MKRYFIQCKAFWQYHCYLFASSGALYVTNKMRHYRSGRTNFFVFTQPNPMLQNHQCHSGQPTQQSSYVGAYPRPLTSLFSSDPSPQDQTSCAPRYTASSLLIVFLSVLMGALEIGQASPYVEAFSMAKGAAAIIFAIIDRQPTIDSSSSEGLKPESAKGRIQLQDVKFHYPSRWVGGWWV